MSEINLFIIILSIYVCFHLYSSHSQSIFKLEKKKKKLEKSYTACVSMSNKLWIPGVERTLSKCTIIWRLCCFGKKNMMVWDFSLLLCLLQNTMAFHVSLSEHALDFSSLTARKKRTYNFQNKLWRPKIIQLITYYLRQQTAMGGPKRHTHNH